MAPLIHRWSHSIPFKPRHLQHATVTAQNGSDDEGEVLLTQCIGACGTDCTPPSGGVTAYKISFSGLLCASIEQPTSQINSALSVHCAVQESKIPRHVLFIPGFLTSEDISLYPITSGQVCLFCCLLYHSSQETWTTLLSALIWKQAPLGIKGLTSE